ncbi:MAG: acyltransferase [Lachnospiraceae bacterium]|nr:acyltransferase [Lachnospiraceae bacterium]
MDKKRNANIELLRILSMLMVTMLHALGKSELLVPLGSYASGNAWIAWILEALSIVAVNIFMLISGYFLIHSEFKWKRLVEILAQVLFYTVGTFLVFHVLGQTIEFELTIHSLLSYFLPIHMDVYWFITAYVVIYALSPLLSAGVKALSEKQLRGVILLMLVYECVIKSVLPFVLETDSKGYSVLWYLIMFLVGAYFKLYGIPFVDTVGRGMAAYFGGCALVVAEVFVLSRISEHTGRLTEIGRISTHYNHLFVVVASIGIFSAFLNRNPMKDGASKVICAISPYALGVYLFQESLTMRYRWQEWFRLDDAMEASVIVFLLRVFGSVIVMFVLGILVDVIRSLIFRGVASVRKHN